MNASESIRLLLRRVRGRTRKLRLYGAIVRASLAASAVLLAALASAPWTERSLPALTALAGVTLLALLAATAWGLARLRGAPSDLQVARFIEERVPRLDDRLVTAVDVMRGPAKAGHDLRWDHRTLSPLAAPMLADAALRASQVDLDEIIPGRLVRRGGVRAAAAALFLVIVVSLGRGPLRQAFDAAWLALYASRVTLEVHPGDVRLQNGMPLSIEARLVGARAPLPAEVQIADGDLWRSAGMVRVSDASFQLALASVSRPFKYRVVLGSLTSPTYSVIVSQAPRVARIDLDYSYPAALGLPQRSEEDGGDIYAPAATDVRLRIHTDHPVASGRLRFGDGKTLELRADATTVLTTRLKIVEDGSYRVALTDAEGLSNPGETEYFIRMLADRPPDVHVIKPAGDLSVTRLQEVEIEAQADDDYGIDRVELVYAVRGGEEHVFAFDVPRRAASVAARHTLYLEDLDLEPGDFVSYYVRARDLSRGAGSKETRSDIFFLDVRPFEQDFSLAQSQSMAGSGYAGAIDELVNAQRQVVVATWKIERRARTANGAPSASDVQAIARTEAELKDRAERTASSFRTSAMRDPRPRAAGGGSAAGGRMPEEDAMATAVRAMDRAVVSLDRVRVDKALPSEMQALNFLLKAQAEIRHRQIALDASASGNASRNFDISTLFDQELRRQQQTSYETSKSSPQTSEPESKALAAIRDLARRQDELLKRQQALAQPQVSDEEQKRQLEQLTREQAALRQRAEELAREMSGLPQRGRSSNDRDARMWEVSEDMRQAAGELRRGSPRQAGSSAGRALDRLRELEKGMQLSRPDERRQVLGQLQLEARELADRLRQVASDLAKLEKGDAGNDSQRRLAGDEERLLQRARQLEGRLKALAGEPESGRNANRTAQADDLARQLDRLADRLAAAGAGDDESRRLSDRMARTERLRDNLDRVSRALEAARDEAQQAAAERSPQKAPGERGRTGQGRQGAGGSDLTRLREESLRSLREVKDLVEQLRREDPSRSENGAGFTFEGQGFIFSAPGAEAFKQDVARWDVLRQQASVALDEAEATLSKKLRAKDSRDRLAAGVDDQAPPEYQRQVDRYFKALASGRKP